MARATGADAKAYLNVESSFGNASGNDFYRIPFVAGVGIGAEQGLETDPILGQGRDPATSQRGEVNAGGPFNVPVDQHNFGFWLSLLLGTPTTTQMPAAGTITFDDNPTNGDTITLNGVVWTFVTSGASGAETNIQGDLAATLAQLVTDLNGSADTDIDDATYTENDTQLIVTHDTAGAVGNDYTLAASADTVSGPTLTGGGYRHRFVSGKNTLPSYSIEMAHERVPAFMMNNGLVADTMGINFQTSGLATANFTLIGQDETPSATTQAGTPQTLNGGAVDSFSNFRGSIKRNGTALGNVEASSFNYSNNLDPVRVIRPDGLIQDIDPAGAQLTGAITARFDSLQFLNDAQNDTELELEYGFVINDHKKLVFTNHNVKLPRTRQPVDGAGGIRATYNWQGGYDAAAGQMMTVDLHNDYDGSAYPS